MGRISGWWLRRWPSGVVGRGAIRGPQRPHTPGAWRGGWRVGIGPGGGGGGGEPVSNPTTHKARSLVLFDCLSALLHLTNSQTEY